MTYSKGKQVISIETRDLVGGKRPGLYIGNECTVRKVACFRNLDEAKAFQDVLEYFFGDFLVREEKE